MHICIISSYFPEPCGIASYTHYLAQALKFSDKALKLTLVTEKSNEGQYSLPFNICPAFDRNGDYPAQLSTVLKKLNPDVVHIQHEYGIFGYDHRFLNLLEQLRLAAISTVVTLHTVHTQLSFFTGCTRPQVRSLLKKVNIEKYQQRLGELADMVIVHQERSIRQVLLRQGLSAKKVVTIAHGTRLAKPIDENLAKLALGVNAHEPLIVAFGYLEPSKNLLFLIKAFKKVKAHLPDAKLLLCGYIRFPSSQSLSYKARCLKLIDEYKLKYDVIFKDDMIPEDQVSDVLSAADIISFVYNEDTRSSSGALHIALGLGKTVVASRIAKFDELSEISDEVLVNLQSVRELSTLLKRLIQDNEFKSYIKNQVAVFARETSWPLVAEQHCRVYSTLAPMEKAGKFYLKTVNQ